LFLLLKLLLLSVETKSFHSVMLCLTLLFYVQAPPNAYFTVVDDGRDSCFNGGLFEPLSDSCPNVAVLAVVNGLAAKATDALVCGCASLPSPPTHVGQVRATSTRFPLAPWKRLRRKLPLYL